MDSSRPRRRVVAGFASLAALLASLSLPSLASARGGDSDQDGLSNRQESRYRTNPHRKDTDRDRLRDGREVRRYHTNPRRRDTDGDGLSDRLELRRTHTNPRRRDTDGDRLSDGIELRRAATKRPRKDTTPPETGITSGPSGTIGTDSASFAFSSSETRSTFDCRLDGSAWAPCSSPKAYSGLAEGLHSFEVKAKDPAGNVDPTPAHRSWTISRPDTTPPSVSFWAPLAGQVVSGQLSEAYGNCEALASDAGGIQQIEFYLDGMLTNTETMSPYACTIDSTAYSDGSHTITAKAYDNAGNTSQSSVSVLFDNVPGDTAPPDTTITAGPSGTISTASTSFSFSSTVTGSSFECRLDDGLWVACTSPKAYTGLANGSHTFEVRAKDLAGNTDRSPASRTFSVSVATGGRTLYMSPTGSDANSCSQATPCRTLNRAYQVADAGDTVELAAGTYGDIALNGDSRVLASAITFRPVAGASVSFGSRLVITARNVELRDMTMRYDIKGPARDVVMRNIVVPGTFQVYSEGTSSSQGAAPENISIIGGSTGPSVDAPSRIASNFSTLSPKNVLVDGVKFHDYTRTSTAVHTECLQVWAADGLTVRNSTFKNCAVFDVYVQHVDPTATSRPPATPSNVTIENNFFDCCADGSNYSLRFSDTHGEGTWRNLTVRGNTANERFSFGSDNGVAYSGSKVVSNVAPALHRSTSAATTAIPGLATDYNVWYSGNKLGTHDKNGIDPNTLFMNYAADDFHLAPGSAAIDAGSPTDMPATDIDGDTRPQGIAPDAGADEARTTAQPGDTTPPDTTIAAGPAEGSIITTSSTSLYFRSSEAGSTFECKLDSGAWGACSSPKAYSGLANGSHSFSVRAADAAGNIDPSPAARSFTVSAPPATPPDTSITAGPAEGSTITSGSTSFSFSSSEAGVTFKCRLDSSAWGACSSPKPYAGLSNGAHSFSVMATDAAGDSDPSPATRNFTVSVPNSGSCDAQVTTQPALVAAAGNSAYEGRVVCVRGGAYGAATFRGINHATKVTLKAYPGETPVLGYTVIDGVQGLRFEGLTWRAGGVDIWPGTNARLEFVGNTFADYSGAGINLYYGVNDLLIQGNSFRNLDEGVPGTGDGGYRGVAINTNSYQAPYSTNIRVLDNKFDGTQGSGILFSGVRNSVVQGNEIAHVYPKTPPPGVEITHADPMAFFGGSDLTIRDNYVHDNRLQILFEGPVANVVMEDNLIVRTDAWGVGIKNDLPNLNFNHNTIWNPAGLGGVYFSSGASSGSVRNNVLSSMSITGSIADEDYNVTGRGGGTGSHDQVCSPSFVNPPADDYHIASGSPCPSGFSAGYR